jgi:hypothetical protein
MRAILLLILLNIFLLEAEKVIYVNGNGNRTVKNGGSWESAYDNLQDALTTARGITKGCMSIQIWVAKGTYKPRVIYGSGYTGTESNLVTFNLSTRNSIYGGFNGTETKLSQRNLKFNPTILSGDILGDDIKGSSSNKNDNAWHVLTADGITDVVVDSFIIEGGYASGPDYGTVVLGPRNVSLITSINYAHNLGGGLMARRGANILLNNVHFRDNMANSSKATMLALKSPNPALGAGGGALGICERFTLVTVTKSKFTDNLATMFGTDGGAVNVINEGSLKMIECTVNDNKGNRNGGAIHSRRSKDLICINTTFFNNQIIGTDVGDEGGAAIGAFDSDLNIKSCIFDSNVMKSGVGPGGILFHSPFNDGIVYTLSVENSVFKNNVGKLFGGAINIFGFISNSDTSAEIISSLFENNTAAIGAGIFVDSIATKITNCSFDKNKASVSGAGVFGSNFANSISNRTDMSERLKLKITSCSFKKNSVTPTSGTLSSSVFVFDLLARDFSGRIARPLAGVTNISIGGAAVASEFGGKINITSSTFTSNNATTGRGGAILIGGSVGFAGGSPLGMNQAYLKIQNSTATRNTDKTGSNNVAVLDPTGLGSNLDGVKFLTDGSVIAS